MWSAYVSRVRAQDGVLVECHKDEKDISSVSQSDMYLYRSYEIIGAVRKTPAPIVNGVMYIVKEVKAKSEACPEGSVTVCMHEDYSPFAKLEQDNSRRGALEYNVEEVSDLTLAAADNMRTPQSLLRQASPDLLRTLKARIPIGNETLRWTHVSSQKHLHWTVRKCV